MWTCVNNCMRRQLPGFGFWVLVVVIAAIVAAIFGPFGISVVVATAAIAIGAAGVTVALFCYSSCRI